MKTFALALILSLGVAAPLLADEGTNILSDDMARASYALGMMLGHNWKQQGLDVDYDLILRGVEDVSSGKPTLLTPEEMSATLEKFKQQLMAKQQKMHEEELVKNRAEGEAFLATNKNNPGVITLPDGLQYMVITNGSGPIPAANDTVTVNYRGMLLDGTEFDSSYKRGQPAQFPVNGVIHGWTEALEKMPVGSKWKLFIPADLAYGERGNRGIPPDSVLIFDVDLLDAKAPAKPVMSTVPTTSQPLTSDIIKVPSAAEMKKGAKIEVIKPGDVEKMQNSTNN
mgnify:FL=1